MVADDDDVQSEDLDMHQITCALQIRKVERSMILCDAQHVCTITKTRLVGAFRITLLTEHFAPLCKRNPC